MTAICFPFIVITFILVPALGNQDAVSEYGQVRDQIRTDEQVGREIMARLYEINNRMKRISRRRSLIGDKVAATEAKVRGLTHSTAQLDSAIGEQRRRLSRRLRALYMLGQDKVARAIFSAGNSEDLKKTLKYLKRFTEQDYHLIRTYESNLTILSKKQSALDDELRRLITYRRQLEGQEKALDADQIAKTKFLEKLDEKKEDNLHKLKAIRQSIGTKPESLLNLSFFEQKGKLAIPLQGSVVRDFGIIENEEFGYQLSHKGILYTAIKPSPITAIHAGKVAFFGNIDGYGKTLIIDHGDHYYSIYSGIQSVSVAEGDEVSNGQVITEKAKQLYFELRHFSDAIDPKHWFYSQRGES